MIAPVPTARDAQSARTQPFSPTSDVRRETGTSEAPQRGHSGAADTIPSLDGLRAISVLIVLVSHAGFGNTVPGGLGVTIFFFLSGYLITTLLLAEWKLTDTINIAHFFARRLFRLFPPLIVTLAIAYALTFLGILPGGLSLSGFLAQIFYFANYYSIFVDFPGHTIPQGTGILWSLAVEEHFYIIYPAALAVLLRFRLSARSIALALGMICVAILAWRLHLFGLPGFQPYRTYYASDTRIDSILFGCILAISFNPLRPQLDGSAAIRGGASRLGMTAWALLGAAVLLMLTTLVVRDPMFRETIRYSLQGLALMPIFYYAVRYSHCAPFTALNHPMAVKIGIYSYAIYLSHYIVIKAIEANVPALAENRSFLIVATLAVAIGFAAALDQWIDPYFRELRRRFRSIPHAV